MRSYAFSTKLYLNPHVYFMADDKKEYKIAVTESLGKENLGHPGEYWRIILELLN